MKEVLLRVSDDKFERFLLAISQQTNDVILEAFHNGTILPEGHGRLGDLDALEKLCSEHKISNSALYNSPIIEQGLYDDGDCIWQPLFDFAPTIIEADRSAE